MQIDRHFPCIIKVAQMSATSGDVSDIPCRGSWEMAMIKLLTLHSESGSRHYKRCSFIVKLLNIASFGLSNTHASPLMRVTCMRFPKSNTLKNTYAHYVGLSMSNRVLHPSTIHPSIHQLSYPLYTQWCRGAHVFSYQKRRN